MKKTATIKDLINFIELCEKNKIEFYLDGGWCVDVLLGKQTREHEDIDVGVPRADAKKLRKVLENEGYEEVVREDSSDWNYVLADKNGHQIDIHTYQIGRDGHIVWGVEYPIESLTGKGNIKGKKVNCISPKWMIEFKTWYEPDQNDYHDVKLLCQEFGISLPEKYKKFEK